MTVRAYCDAAYALIVGEYQRRGMSLEAALERISDWGLATGRTATSPVVNVAAKNEESLRKLDAMMGGLGA